ncbi:MAG: ubiquinone/menaquinone biosynthesis methyltransferase [Methanobacterium sp. PtaU1.Bin242]|nr:MAG: ubiquinone/menaquinone biosynthesis methyltransferase [Methanobacterium sp. PtaU1.Bin242]
MSKFENSEWAEKKHAKNFMENANIYVLERQRLLGILRSFYRYFSSSMSSEESIKVLDLGCGEGVLTLELLKENDQIKATLIDGSAEMLKNARENLNNYNNINFIQKTFQQLIEDGSGENILTDGFDFIVSSLAIHHLYNGEKKSLFQYIYDNLNSGGFFLNIETVKAPTNELESWYRVIWKEWIQENQIKLDVKKSFEYLPEQYKNNPDNHPDTLETQLNMLKSIGFKQVDCYYKYGIFTIFGGRK